MSERILFCRISWMVRYRGQDGEFGVPENGGRWVDDGNEPNESHNFASFGGDIYGYARPAMGTRSIKLERIDPIARGPYVDGVRVIFFAQGPVGQVIVGWYEKARVLRDHLLGPDGLRDDLRYLFICPEDNAVLLPVAVRTHPIPRGKGGTGQANITYVLDDKGRSKGEPWMAEAIGYTKAAAR